MGNEFIYHISDPVYSEHCYCPEGDIEAWQEAVGCPAHYPQVTRDLALFPQVDFDAILSAAAKRFDAAGSRSFCNYVVKNNQVGNAFQR